MCSRVYFRLQWIQTIWHCRRRHSQKINRLWIPCSNNVMASLRWSHDWANWIRRQAWTWQILWCYDSD
jgi:hypothetical protein